MLRNRLFLLPALLSTALAFGCSEGTEETATPGDDDAADDDAPAPAGDDDAADDDTPAPAGDDDTADDDTPAPAGDDDAPAPAGDDDATPGVEETLIDVTTAMRDVAAYETTKEYLTDVATIAESADEGDPAPSLRLEIPYTNYNQFIEFQYLVDQVNGGMSWDFTGKVVSLRLKVEASGYTDLACPGGIRFFVKAGESYAYAGRTWISTPAASDNWVTYEFDPTTAEPGSGLTLADIDFSDVRAIGFGFESADCGGVYLPGDPPPETDPPSTAVFYMEDLTIRDGG